MRNMRDKSMRKHRGETGVCRLRDWISWNEDKKARRCMSQSLKTIERLLKNQSIRPRIKLTVLP